MKLATRKLRKVGKVPVELSNKFCSHLDPMTSAELISANELAAMDPKNPFAGQWKDREHRPPKEFKDIPRHFYTNYKTNLIRDAHYMAKAIVGNRSQSPMSRSCL